MPRISVQAIKEGAIKDCVNSVKYFKVLNCYIQYLRYFYLNKNLSLHRIFALI